MIQHYSLQINKLNEVMVPENSKILTVMYANGQSRLYVDAPVEGVETVSYEAVNIAVLFTGRTVLPNSEYISSYTVGSLVLHAFRVRD